MKSLTYLLKAMIVFMFIMIGMSLLTAFSVCVGYLISVIFPLTLFHASLLSIIATSSVFIAFIFILAEDKKRTEEGHDFLDDLFFEKDTVVKGQNATKKRKQKSKKVVALDVTHKPRKK